MAIRTLDQLQSALTDDLRWRLHELQQWEQVVARVREHEQPALLRGGTAILYSHWEGYVRTAATLYLEYVSRKGLRLIDLRDELAAVAMRQDLLKGEQSKTSADHTAILRRVRSDEELPAELPYKSATVRTRANLKFDVFADIMHSLGCDANRHELYQATIDGRLLRHRNSISHGREDYVELQDWRDMRDRVVAILQDVRTQISNAAALEQYRRQSSPPRTVATVIAPNT